MRTLTAIATLALLALCPGVVAAHGDSTVAVAGHPHADGPIDIKGGDFEANEVVTLELREQGQAPVLLGSVPVEPDGTFEVTLQVPADVRPGLYELVAIAGEESTSAEVTILEPPEGSSSDAGTTEEEDISNDRPKGETVGLAIVTAVLAAAGGAIILLGRRDSARRLPR